MDGFVTGGRGVGWGLAYKHAVYVIPYFICLSFIFFMCKKPPPPPSGAIKFGDTAEECTSIIAGTVRYNTSQNALELCNGNSWSPSLAGGLGQTPDRPGQLSLILCFHVMS